MPANSKNANVFLWTAQILLAALFLFAGGFKLFAPAASLAGQIALPAPFLRFIGAAELLGGLGLVLPGLVRVHQWLTPLAAMGLVVIMAGATALTAVGVGLSAAVVPLIVGLLCVAVGRGRGGLGAVAAARAAAVSGA